MSHAKPIFPRWMKDASELATECDATHLHRQDVLRDRHHMRVDKCLPALLTHIVNTHRPGELRSYVNSILDLRLGRAFVRVNNAYYDGADDERKHTEHGTPKPS